VKFDVNDGGSISRSKYTFNTFLLIYDVRAEMRPHEWLGGVLGVLGFAPSARTSKINRKMLKGYGRNFISAEFKFLSNASIIALMSNSTVH
jgi:hypothetical protein